MLTKCNLLEGNDDSHQHEVTLTLADFDIDLTKSISMTVQYCVGYVNVVNMVVTYAVNLTSNSI